ncbi:hypothetical protein I6H70_01535 [Stutzerimonas balearica]|uniref:Uncharacterized protein n=1 Tax=Stutzerimonas balearica TaxID=74829 RepID=A0A9X7YR75_9GAMM|nr:hypothetical protein [Stutzerimonas balearica]QQN51188.1 hypothetical protein I6H70_01535 [Stutzerimonas balearica]
MNAYEQLLAIDLLLMFRQDFRRTDHGRLSLRNLNNKQRVHHQHHCSDTP